MIGMVLKFPRIELGARPKNLVETNQNFKEFIIELQELYFKKDENEDYKTTIRLALLIGNDALDNLHRINTRLEKQGILDDQFQEIVKKTNEYIDVVEDWYNNSNLITP